MTPLEIEQVFGRGRLKMATGEHVEVFREAIVAGERRRYTKRFLTTHDGDFGPWTEREWRILARLIGHGIRCVPDVVQFDGGALGGARLVQTYDAGITVDQWGTLLPVARHGEAYRHVFEDCAHWWSLAHHCLSALDEIHALGLVHLDIKGDNICIPYGPSDFDPNAPSMRLRPEFGRLALIDFAFSLVSRESLAMPLPIGWQKDYDYQSPRLLRALDQGRNGDLEPTRELDWRCDLYSLAAMLKRYLPPDGSADESGRETGWTAQRYDDARTLIFRLRDSHDRELPHWRPHGQFIDYASARLDAPDLAGSLADGWSLARDTVTVGIATPMTAITPMTRIAPMIRTVRRGRGREPMQSARTTTPDDATGRSAAIAVAASTRAVSPESALTAVTAVSASDWDLSSHLTGTEASRAPARRMSQRALPACILVASLVAVASPSFIGNPAQPLADRARELLAELRLPLDRPAEEVARHAVTAPSAAVAAAPAVNTEVDRRSSAEAAPKTESTAPASSTDGVADASPMRPAPDAAVESVAAAPDLGLGSVVSEGADEPVAVPRGNSRPPSKAPAAVGGLVARTPESSRAKVAQASPYRDAAQARTTVKRSPSASGNAPSVPAKQYADATRRPPAHAAAATRDRAAQPPRMALATATSKTPALPHGVPSPSTADRPAGESVPQHAGPSPVGAIAQSETGSKDRELVASRAGAGAAPATTVSGASKASETPTASAGSTPTQRAASAERRADWRNPLAALLGLFNERAGSPAPVEDRTLPQSGKPTAASRALARAATDAVVRASVVSSAAASTSSPATIAPAPQNIAPLQNASPQDARSPAVVALVSEPTVRGQRGPASEPSTPDRYVAATASIPASPPPPETRYVPAPRNVAAPRDYPRDDAQDFAAQARRLLIDTVPRVAARAEPEVSRVLSAAAISHHPAQARLVIAAADGPWPSESEWIAVTETKPAYARRLHNEARRASASGGDIADTVNAELQAFGANPRDPDIGGYLALLYLRMTPSRPELARQLALHAIVQSGSRRSTRAAEWNTFAVASALTGREADAARAFLTEAAFTANVDRSCQSALSAYANYGEPLRAPVLALLQRVNAQGRAYGAPSCTWPAYWSAAARAGISY